MDNDDASVKRLTRQVKDARQRLTDQEIDDLAHSRAVDMLIDTYPGSFEVLYEGFRAEVRRELNGKKPLLRRIRRGTK